MNKKVIIVLVVILMTAVIAGGFWYVKSQDKNNIIDSVQSLEDTQKKQDGTSKNVKGIEELNFDEVDVSDWKTYRNEEHGFEVKYPKDWIFDEPAYPSSIPYEHKLEVDYVVGFAKGSFEGDWTIIFAVGKDENSFNQSWSWDIEQENSQDFNGMYIKTTKWENTCNTMALYDNVSGKYLMNIDGYCIEYKTEFDTKNVLTGMIKTLKFD